MRRIQPTAIIVIVLLGLVGCQKPRAPELTSLVIGPEHGRIARGTSIDFVATGQYDDGSVRDVTREVVWQVVDGFVGTIDAQTPGRVHGLQVGGTKVRAVLGAVSREMPFSVVGGAVVRLEVSPSTPVVPVGLSVQLRVNAVRADDSVEDVTGAALYMPAGTAGVTMRDEAPGVILGTKTGPSPVHVTFGGVSAEVVVTVTDATIRQLTVAPGSPSVPLGASLPLTATASLSDGRSLDVTEQAQWTSSAPQVAFVATLPGERGTLTGRALGTTEVQASLRGVEGAVAVTVTDAVLARVEVSPAKLTLARGTRTLLAAQAIYSDGTRLDLPAQGAWSSGAPAVVSVSAHGLARALELGSAQLRFEHLGHAANLQVTVTDAELTGVEVSPSPVTLAAGTNAQLTATGRFSDGSTQDVTASALWSSVGPTVAQVSNAAGRRGFVEALLAGGTQVLATVGAHTGRVQVTVTPARLESLSLSPAALSLPLGTSADVVATGVFSDGSSQDLTRQVSWTSAASATVSVDPATNPGRVRALAVGQAEVQAQYQAITATVAISVTPAVLRQLELAPAAPSLARGTSTQLSATGVFSDATTRDLTAQAVWSSDEPSVAAVSNAAGSVGLLTAANVGETRVRATFQGVTGSAPVQITAAALVSLSVSQTTVSLPVGVETTLVVTGLYSDGTTQDLTTQATWSSADSSVAIASNAAGTRGLVRAAAVGTTSVTAAFAGRSVPVTVVVSPAQLTGLSLTPAIASMPRGTTQAFVATGTWSDGTSRDVGAQATWSSSGPALSVSSAGVATALQLGVADVVVRLGGREARVGITVTQATLTALSLTPALPTAPIGVTVPFVAMGTYSDGTTQDLTAQVAWSSSAPTVATVSNAAGTRGRASALSVGTTDVGATFGGQAVQTTLTVVAAALDRVEVTPALASIANGTSARFQATGRYTDGSAVDLSAQATWSVSDTALASVSNSGPTVGRVSALQPGTVQVRATAQGVVGAASLEIRATTLSALTISPGAPSAAAGLSLSLSVMGTFSDATSQDLTEQASWSSSAPARVTISNAAGSHGLARALAVGTADVTATALGQSATVTFTVTNALLTGLDVTPPMASVARGLTRDFVATGRFSDGTTADVSEQASWSSSSAAVATVSNAAGSRGRATAAGVGTATVTASLQGQASSATLTVTPAVLQQLQVSPPSATLPAGVSASFTVTGVYSDATTQDLTQQAVWSSSASAVASVSNAAGARGQVQALAVGSATITASHDGVSVAAAVTVTAAQLVSVQVGPQGLSVPRGLVHQLSATGHYTDGTTRDLTAGAGWSSSDVSLASVSNASGSEGMLQAHDEGVVTITATSGGRTGSVQVTVSPAVLQVVQVTPAMPSVPQGLDEALTATGIYSDSSTQDLTAQATWSSSDEAVVRVSNAAGSHGVITGLALGTASVRATLSGVTGSTTVTVTPSVLQQLQVTPANPSRPRGLSAQLTATGVFSDGSTQDLTAQVAWTAGDGSVVSVSNAAGSEGLATALSEGSTTVSASLSGVTGSTGFTVTAAQLTRVDLSPSSLNLPLGSARALQAIGRYTDGSTQTLTAQATWSSSAPSVLQVSNAQGNQGLATTISVGTAQVSASVGGFTATVTATITQAQLSSVELTPAAASTPLGFTRQFIAIGHYTDGTTQVLTSQATWSSSDTSKAVISNASGSRGLLSTVSPGAVTIEAVYNGVTGSTSHTVTAAVLVSLTLTPSPASVQAGSSVALVAQGHYSDGSSQDVTASVTWSSSDTAVAQVSNAAGSEGVASGLSAGTTTVRAQSGGVSQTVDLTVTP